MEQRLLGRSGCAVSVLALGTMTFGRETDEDESSAQLDRFVEAGGTLLDTADIYAGSASETIIGRWRAARPPDVRDRTVIATKGRFRTGGAPNDIGLSRRHLSRALDASLRRLQVDAIDLYQFHAFDPLTPLEETLRFVDDAVRAGKIHYFGLSNFTAWQLQQAVDLADFRSLTRPVSLQPQYNLLAREIEWEIVPACLAAGVGLLPWSPLAGGWLTGKYRPDTLPAAGTRLRDSEILSIEAYDRRSSQQRTWDVVEAVRDIADARGVSMAQVALAWLAARPGVASVVIGARTTAQLDDNLRAAELRLTPDETARLDTASDPGAADYPYGDFAIDQRNRTLQ